MDQAVIKFYRKLIKEDFQILGIGECFYIYKQSASM